MHKGGRCEKPSNEYDLKVSVGKATAAATVEYDVIELKNNESTDQTIINTSSNVAYGEIKPLYLWYSQSIKVSHRKL